MGTVVSVVTIVKDHEKGLRNTLKSLIIQEYENWESIVVVGDSSDKTYEVACEFADQDSGIKILRQSDKGIYQAMNLGTHNAAGDFVHQYLGTSWHACGTCKMGSPNDPLAVTNSRGEVLGTRNLFVADASLMPRVTRTNTNIPTIMIAERIADLIQSCKPRTSGL